MTATRNDWILVLAGGEGKRLASVAEDDGYGPVPKQFCHYLGRRTLLERTIDRAQRLTDPARVMTIVTAAHARWWEEHLRSRPAGWWVVQSENRGTAVGVLLPLLEVARRDPDAVVTLLPSDHDALDPDVLTAATVGAARTAHLSERDVVLLGITPDEPAPDYGYILPGADDGRSQAVAGFIEKPSPEVARDLVQCGAMWHSLILSARVSALLSLFATHQGDLLNAIIARTMRVANGDRVVKVSSRSLPVRDFSHDVLERAIDRLRVRRAPYCGWSDVGTPERLKRRMRGRDQAVTPHPLRTP